MDLIISIGLLTAVILIADVALALQGNWPRILRVTLSASVYVGVLGTLLRMAGRFGAPAARLPLWVFLVAGAAAGLVSGVVRTATTPALVVASAVLTPTLLGAFHWIALQRWALIRGRMSARRRQRSAGDPGERRGSREGR